MPPRLENLKIHAFRGASVPVEIPFDTNLPASMIFGENASGKSSIVDAIDFVCHGNFGSLELRRLGSGQRKHRFVPSVGKVSGDVGVEITFAGKTWTATHGNNGAVLCKTPSRPRPFILRRSDLLEFVDADPAERYQKLASYIAVGEIEKGEATLREAKTLIDRQVYEATRATVQAENALQEFWDLEGKPGASRDEWARSEAAKDSSELTATVKACADLRDAAARLKRASEERERTRVQADSANQGLKDSEKELADAATSFATGATALLGVLRGTQTYLEENPAVTDCPVCEQTVDSAELGKRLADRIKDLNQLESAVKSRDTAQKRKDVAAEQFKQANKSFLESSRTSANLAAGTALPEMQGLGINWGQYAHLQDEEVALSDPVVETEAEQFIANRERIESVVQDRLEADQKSLNQLNAIKQHVQTVDTKTKELTELTELQKRAGEALKILESTRKTSVDVLLESVSGEVDEFYTRLHPGEALGSFRLYLDEKRRGSLKFAGQFESVPDAVPQGYYSESHLDTLGVCMFLALAKKFMTPESFVVLDDVFTSVDQAHLDRLIQLIHDQADHLNHLILTTHYRPWRDAYRYYRGPALKIQLIELLPWTLKRGIRHTKTKLVVDELVESLGKEPLDRQGVSSKAGILLENLLDHLTLLYECRVPRRGDPRFTLGDLMNALDSKLRRALKVTRPSPEKDAPPIEQELKTALEGLASTAWIRNEVGCHFVLDGNVSDTNVQEFAERVRDIATLMICENCGELPRSKKTGVDRKCRCGHVRMLPVTAPE